MTVPYKPPRRVVANTGNVTDIAIDFPVEKTTDVVVYAGDPGAFRMTLGADYTVDGVGSPAGVTININNPTAWDGYDSFAVYIEYTIDQNSDVDSGGTLGKRFEAALDRATHVLQSMNDKINRAVKLPITSAVDDENVIEPAPGQLLGWDADGKLINKTSEGTSQAAAEAAAAIAVAVAALFASIVPVQANAGKLLRVSTSSLVLEAVLATPSAMGMRGGDNSFTDPQMLDRANYAVTGNFIWQDDAVTGSGSGRLVLNGINSAQASVADIVARSPLMAVQHDAVEWYEGQFGTGGSTSFGTAPAKLEVEFFSDLFGLVSLGRRLVGITSTAGARDQATGAAHRAPSTARSARFVMTRLGHATAVTGAYFSNLSKMRYKALDRKVEFRVGNASSPTAHYRSAQEAVDCLHQATYTRNVSYLKTATATDPLGIRLMTEAGHKWTEGLSVSWGDYGRFELVAEDSVVLLDPAFAGKSAVPFYARGTVGSAPDDPTDETEHLIMGYYARMPVLGCTFNMENLYDNGYVAIEGCTGQVRPGNGVLRAGHNGLDVRASNVNADYTVWDGANNHAVRVAYTGSLTAQGVQGDFAGQAPDPDSFNALDVSRTSTCHARSCKIRNAGRKWDGSGTVMSAMCAANVRRNSRLTVEDGDMSGATGRPSEGYGGMMVQHGSTVSAFRLKLNDIADGPPLRISTGARVNADQLETLRRNNSVVAVTFDAGGVLSSVAPVTSTGAGASRAMNIGDTNLANFNVPDSAGMFYIPDMPSPLQMGEFSDTGVTSGKRILGPAGILDSSRAETSTQAHLRFYNGSGALAGQVTTAGSPTPSTAYATTSDETWKIFTGEYSGEDAAAIIRADPVRTFDWIEEKGGGKNIVGWGAQTSFKVHRDLATEGGWQRFDPDTGLCVPCEEGDEGAQYMPWGVDQGKRTPFLWAAVKMLLDNQDAMRAEIDALKKQIAKPAQKRTARKPAK